MSHKRYEFIKIFLEFIKTWIEYKMFFLLQINSKNTHQIIKCKLISVNHFINNIKNLTLLPYPLGKYKDQNT